MASGVDVANGHACAAWPAQAQPFGFASHLRVDPLVLLIDQRNSSHTFSPTHGMISSVTNSLKKENILLISLVIVYLVITLFHLGILPIFTDESIHIYRAKLIASSNKQWFISLIDGEPPLFIWMVVFFLKLFPPTWYLVAGRLPSIMAGLLGLI